MVHVTPEVEDGGVDGAELIERWILRVDPFAVEITCQRRVARHALPADHAEETGEGDGAGENLNIPLRAGATDAEYLEATDRAIEAIGGAPGSIVVVSLGFDTYGLDPIGDFALTTSIYHEVGRRVAALGRRLVILQEGGYHRPSLGENARAWLRGAEGRSFEPLPVAGFTEQGTVV